MIKEIVARVMEKLELPYAYWEYPRTNETSYFVGARMELPQSQGDGAATGTFIISGWSYIGLDPLDGAEGKLRAAFSDLRIRDPLGTCCISYSMASDVPSDVEGICRVDYTLDYTEWSN